MKQFIAVFVFILCFYAGYARAEGIFREWNYNSTKVFGISKLESAKERWHYKITKADAQSYRIQRFNPAGILTNTTVVRYTAGKISMVTETDQWGFTYTIAKFTPAGPDEFIVTQRTRGVNDLRPCKAVKYTYRNGMLAEKRYLSYSNQLMANADGVAIIKYKRYDDAPRYSLLKEQSFYGADSKPVISKSWDCFKVVYEYDTRANRLSYYAYGLTNEPVTDRYGVHGYRYLYDKNDQSIQEEYVGLDGEPTANSYGVTANRNEYTGGFVAKVSRVNRNGNVVRSTSASDGVAIIKYQYDINGNETSRAHYDEYGSAIVSTSGSHAVYYKYNGNNNLISVRYFDKYNSPTTDNYGIHEYKYSYNHKGQMISKSFMDKSGIPVQDEHDQVFMVKYEYDEAGRRRSLTFWKDETTKMNRWDGYHQFIAKFNEEGQETETLFYDQNGNLFAEVGGYSRLVYKYNTSAQRTERRLFMDKKPIMLEKNAAIKSFHLIRYYYDANKRVSAIEYFDTSDRPCNASIALDEVFTVQRIEFAYKGTRIVEQKCYKAGSDTPFKIINCLTNDHVSTTGINMGFANK